MFARIRWSPFIALAIFLFAVGQSHVIDRTEGQDRDFVGQIVTISPDGAGLTIQHESIPGVMKHMEMPLRIADRKILQGVNSGDFVKGQLGFRDGAYVLLSVEKSLSPSDLKEVQGSLALLNNQERSLAESQRLCPITGQPLGFMGVPEKVELQGEFVFVCCKGCDEVAAENPSKTLSKVSKSRRAGATGTAH